MTKLQLFLLLLFLFNLSISAQNSSLVIKTNSDAFKGGDTIFFTIKDPSLSVNNNAIIQVELLNDEGGVISLQYLQLSDSKACGFFENKKVNKGILLLRAFTTHKGEVQNLATQVAFVNAEAKMPAQIPFETKDEQIHLSIFPEGNHLLGGFRNRILIKTEDKIYRQAISTSFEIYSSDNKRLTTLTTDLHGLLVLDLGIPEEGLIYIKSIGGLPLITLNGNKNGYTIRCTPKGDCIVVEVNRGLGEQAGNLQLEMFYKGKLINSADIVFDDDIFVVETSMYVGEISTGIVDFQLKNKEGQIFATRHLLMDEVFNLKKQNWPYGNKSNLLADSVINLKYFIKDPYNSDIEYQITDSVGRLLVVDKAERVNDTLIQINDIPLSGKGNIKFYAGKNYSDKQGFIIRKMADSPTSLNELDKLTRMIIANAKKSININSNNEIIVAQKSSKITDLSQLGDIIVETKIRSRIQDLENNYISSAYFKTLFSQSFNVVDDPNALNMSIYDYIAMRIPSLTKRGTNTLLFRNGMVDYWLDETRMDDLDMINIRDVALIVFSKQPVSGLNRGGGALLGRNTPIAGTNGSIAVYSKKGNDLDLNIPRKQVTLPIKGTENCTCY